MNMGQKVKCFPSKTGVGEDSKHTQQPRMQSTLAIWDKQKQDAGQQLSPAGRKEGAALEVRTGMQRSPCTQWGQGHLPDPHLHPT